MTHTQYLCRRFCAPWLARVGGHTVAIRFIPVLVAVALLAAPCQTGRSLFAQDDPFGGIGNAVDGTASQNGQQAQDAPPLPEDLPDDVRLIVEATRKGDPQTPVQLARAIRTMLDLEQYDEARYYLGRLVQAGPNERQMYEMYLQVGADFFLQLRAEETLAPQGRELATSVFAAAKKLATEPAQVDALVRNLSHEHAGFRSNALAQLRRLGAPGAAAILTAFADESRQSEFPYLRTALDSFGPEALGPLVAAARSGNARLQVEAVRSLAYVPVPLAKESLFRWVWGRDVSDAMKTLASESLVRQIGTLPSLEAGERALRQRIREYLTGQIAVGHAPGDHVEIWFWDDAARHYASRVTSQADAARVFAAWLADDLVAIDPDDATAREIWLVARLDAAKRLNGPEQSLSDAVLGSRGPTLATSDLNAALQRALDWDAVAAATGLCELLAARGDGSVLISASNRPSPLVGAVLSGHRHLQFAALQAIDRIDPDRPYRGSSYVVQLAAYLARAQGPGVGVVGHRHSALAQTFASVMTRSGLVDGVAADSGSRLFEEAQWNPDIEVVFVTDGIAAPYFHELVFQLRNDWRTRRLPVAVMVREPGQQQRAELAFGRDELTMIFPGTLDEALIASQVRRLKELYRPWPVTSAQRVQHAIFAQKFLDRILSDREKYGFYEPYMYEKYIVGGVANGVPTPAGMHLLGMLGSALAQQTLTEFASRYGADPKVRAAAVEAFDQAVRRNGLLLSPRQVQTQWDLFQASKGLDDESGDIQSRLIRTIQDSTR